MNTKKIVIGLLSVAVLVLVLVILILPNKNNTDTPIFSPEKTVSEASEHHDDENQDFEIYPGDVAKKIKNNEDIILLDVRRPDEYEVVHLENAKLLSVEELSVQTLEAIGLGANMKDKEIILYCRSGARSQVAYNIMSSLGYSNLKSVQGGMIHWEEDNYPYTESGSYTGPQWTSDVSKNKPSASSSGAAINIPEDFYDFGVIPQSGGTVSQEFVIENSGNNNLEIGNLTTSCSCTSASISDNVIRPGKSAVLTVVFDPDFHEEPLDVFKRTVFIPTNDPNTPEAEVVIQVDIDENN